ncbi:MAG TPA: hypothetical protein VGA70_03705 [Longimicrobiales bacterium]
MSRRAPLSAPSLVALAGATFLASLSLVTWRQGRALEALATLERVREEVVLAQEESGELARSIQYLESRSHLVPAARERLGMHTPGASEIVLLQGDLP